MIGIMVNPFVIFLVGPMDLNQVGFQYICLFDFRRRVLRVNYQLFHYSINLFTPLRFFLALDHSEVLCLIPNWHQKYFL